MRHDISVVSEIISLHQLGYSQRQIAEVVLGDQSKKSTVGDIIRRNMKNPIDLENKPKVLFLDLEVSATIAAVFNRFKAFVDPDAVLQEPYLLTAAWQWLGEPGLHSVGLHQLPSWEVDVTNDLLLVEILWELLDDADIVIAHNASFDTGWCNNRFADYDLGPPSKYKTICTLKALKKHFKLPSNSLKASTNYFELPRKRDNEGIGLWVDCMNGNTGAMDKMLHYNEGDIPTLVSLYDKIKPFIDNHPNMALYYSDDKIRCKTCGSDDMEIMEDKHEYTRVSKFQTYRCNCCGSISRRRKNTLDKDKMTNVLI